MIYYLNLPQLGYSRKVDTPNGEIREIIAEVVLEFNLYRVDDNLLLVRGDKYKYIFENVLDLSEVKEDVSFDWFRGVEVEGTPSYECLRLYNIPLFSRALPFGQYKSQLFCLEHVKSILEDSFTGALNFIMVEDSDLKKFLLSGSHLSSYSQPMKDLLLKGLRKNWDILEPITRKNEEDQE